MLNFVPDRPSSRQTPSPNFGDRKGVLPDHIVLHYTAAIRPARAAVHHRHQSAIYRARGRQYRAMFAKRTAHGMPVHSWAGETDINSVSIGIETSIPVMISAIPTFRARPPR